MENIFESLFREDISACSPDAFMKAMGIALALGVLIIAVYRIVCARAFYRNFAISLLLLTLISSLAGSALQLLPALSTVMLGALLLLCFSKAARGSLEAVFLFWSSSAGLSAGAGLFTLAILAGFAVAVIFLLTVFVVNKLCAPAYILKICYEPGLDKDILKLLEKHFRFQIKSKKMANEGFELLLILRLDAEKLSSASKLYTIDGVREVKILPFAE